MIHNSPKIIFFGTPEFAVIILQKLIDSGITPSAVVTTPDKPAGRGQRLTSSSVKLLAAKHHISLLQPEKLSDEQFLKILRGYTANVFVIAAYGKILPQILLSIPPKGTINVHPSLLPRHRGPSPIQSTILLGDEYAGVTLMLTDEKMDHGPILAQSTYHIAHITYQELHDTLANIGGALLIETLPKWVAGKITPQEQDHAKATFTKLLTKENGHINWSKPAIEIDRVVRALNPWPGAWSYFSVIPSLTRNPENHKEWIPHQVKILAGHPLDEPSPAPPGTLIKIKSGQLAASSGDMLYLIEKLQMEGKRPIVGKDFHEVGMTHLN